MYLHFLGIFIKNRNWDKKKLLVNICNFTKIRMHIQKGFHPIVERLFEYDLPCSKTLSTSCWQEHKVGTEQDCFGLKWQRWNWRGFMNESTLTLSRENFLLRYRQMWLMFELLKVILCEIDVNFCYLCHKMSCYCSEIVHIFTWIYANCSTFKKSIVKNLLS